MKKGMSCRLHCLALGESSRGPKAPVGCLSRNLNFAEVHVPYSSSFFPSTFSRIYKPVIGGSTKTSIFLEHSTGTFPFRQPHSPMRPCTFLLLLGPHFTLAEFLEGATHKR